MRFFSIGLAMFLLSWASVSYADTPAVEERLKKLENRIGALEKRVFEQDKCIHDQQQCIIDQKTKIQEYESRISKLDERLHKEAGPASFLSDGFKIGAWGTMVVQGTDNTNATETKKESRLDGSYTADVTIEKEFEGTGGLAYLHLNAGRSDGLNNDLSLYSNVNDDASDDENVGVTEFYYEQKLLKDKAVLTFGKLDPLSFFDNNNIANDETSQFLAHMFVNNAAIDFPSNGAGIRLGYSAYRWLELGYGVLDADGDWEKMGDNLFNIAEMNFKPNILGLEGNYRFSAWKNDGYHTKWMEPEQDKRSSYGFALSFDQRMNRALTLFCRYSWQNPRVYDPEFTTAGDLNYSLEQAWSAGLQLEGMPWGREKDVLGMAVGQNIASKDYRQAGQELDPQRLAKKEGRIEAYYKIQFNDYLSLSPDIQYIWNPFGRDVIDDDDNIFVYGFRTQIDF